MCWLEKKKRVKWQTLEWNGMARNVQEENIYEKKTKVVEK